MFKFCETFNLTRIYIDIQENIIIANLDGPLILLECNKSSF